jgi:hypothetical protein
MKISFDAKNQSTKLTDYAAPHPIRDDPDETHEESFEEDTP